MKLFPKGFLSDSCDTATPENRSTMVDVNDVSMTFNLANQKYNGLKEYFIAIMKRQLMFREFKVLRDISFTVDKGDVFGILGVNGSGKSTLLKIIAGILKPTSGSVHVYGNIAPLIELGAGFDPELTARENIFLNGALLGYSRDFIEERFDEIVDFAEIRDFLDVPLQNYSSGMVARIAFAIATVIVPDVLIADEVLAVGDFMFQEKCENRIRELIEDHGTTVLLVSHSDQQIERLCNKAIWIDDRHIRMLGSATDVVRAYRMLGGRSGSHAAEEALIKLAEQPPALASSRVSEYVGADRYGVNRTVMKARGYRQEADTVVVASALQPRARLLGTALSQHIGAPLILASAQDSTFANSEYLLELNPKKIIVIDHSGNREESQFNIESQIESLTGVAPTVLRDDDIFALSLAVMECGNGFRSWNRPFVVESAEFASFAIAYPLLSTDIPPVLFLPDGLSPEEAIKMLSEKRLADQIRQFDEILPEGAIKIGAGYSAPFSEIQIMNEAVLSELIRSTEPRNVVITTQHYGLVLSALQIALDQKGCIVIYDSHNLDDMVRVLDLIRTLQPIDHLTFVGLESSFSKIDKELIAKAAFLTVESAD